MAIKDLHDKPFDQGTITKLEIFEAYTQAWLPTFVMSGFQNVCIIDFFAGTGYDKNGIEGSPIRILKMILDHVEIIVNKKTVIHLKLNEYKKSKFKELQTACNRFIESHPVLDSFLKIEYLNLDFFIAFDYCYTDIVNYPSLVFLDQNGVKFLTIDILSQLGKSSKTDFLFFVSASYFKRFGNTPEFRRSIDFDIEKLKANPYQFIHRNLIDILKNTLPKESELQLYPYSIKKRSGIFGLIFGASHLLAVNKFLEIVWKKNGLNGEANFDIEDDMGKAQLSIFEQPKMNKIQSFQIKLREKLLLKEIGNNKEALIYALSKGHIGKHAKDELVKMKNKKEIDFSGKSPKVNYESAIKNNQLITFNILEKKKK